MCFDELYDSIDMITTINFLSVCCSNTGQQNVSLFCFVLFILLLSVLI